MISVVNGCPIAGLIAGTGGTTAAGVVAATATGATDLQELRAESISALAVFLLTNNYLYSVLLQFFKLLARVFRF
jgi:hypothetical protein